MLEILVIDYTNLQRLIIFSYEIVLNLLLVTINISENLWTHKLV